LEKLLNMTMFELDPHLATDTEEVGMLGLCRVLLMRDARYPWLILVPAKPCLVEISDLPPEDRAILMDEITVAGTTLSGLYQPDKINTGALGNIVRQLHVHIVARNTGDPAWPGPVWGHSAALDYDAETLATRMQELRRSLGTA
jgi:diadenosine tetraphosphate (Ap4A) HIT family hydrolase